MKVETKKAIDVAQAVGTGAAAAMGGALGVAGVSAFATLLNSFTSNDTKQTAFTSADFTSTKKTASPSVTASNNKANDAKVSTHKYGKAAVKAAISETANTSAAAPKVENNKSNESNENDADADSTKKTNLKNTAPQADKAQPATHEPVQAQQPVKMEDVIKALNLNEQQVQQLAQALNISVSDLKQMQIAVKADAQTGSAELTAILAGGKEQNLSAMLGMTGGKPASAQVVMDKIAGILNLDNSQKQEFFAQLNISSISFNEVKTASSSTGATTLKNANAAKQADQTQPSAKETPSAIQTGKAAAQEAAQNQTQQDAGGNGGNSFNGEAGAQAVAAPKKNDAISEPGHETNFSTALGKAGETAATTAAHGTKIHAAHATAQTQAADMAKPHDKIMNQIVEKASILQFPNSTQTKISLNPKELGNVDIKLTMHDSSVTASILVENHAVKQTVEQNLDQLKHALQKQGITVDEMLVSVDQQNNGNSQNSNHSQREAAANTPFAGAAPHAAEPAAASAPSMRRPAGDHRISVTA